MHSCFEGSFFFLFLSFLTAADERADRPGSFVARAALPDAAWEGMGVGGRRSDQHISRGEGVAAGGLVCLRCSRQLVPKESSAHPEGLEPVCSEGTSYLDSFLEEFFRAGSLQFQRGWPERRSRETPFSWETRPRMEPGIPNWAFRFIFLLFSFLN